MKRFFYIPILISVFAFSAWAATYFSDPAGSGTACSLVSPCSLDYALSAAGPVDSGDTLCLTAGVNKTYQGKFKSTLTGATVRSCDATGSAAIINETMAGWAIIDGYVTTTLVGTLAAADPYDVESVNIATTAGLFVGDDIVFDDGDPDTADEVLNILSVIDGDTISVQRGWSSSPAEAHSDGETLIHAGQQLQVDADSSTYRDFELWSSYPNRISPATGDTNNIEMSKRGKGIAQFSHDGNNYINLIIRDNLDGFFIGSGTSNTLIYGCLIYNNGHTGEHGSGTYMENEAGYLRVWESMSLNNSGHGFGFRAVSGDSINGDLRGGVMANNGSLNGYAVDGNRVVNLLVGSGGIKNPSFYMDACHLWHPHQANGNLAQLGYASGAENSEVYNSYFVGGSISLDMGNNDDATVTGNKFYSLYSTYSRYANIAATHPYTWNNNNYYRPGTSNPDGFTITGTGILLYNDWKTATGFDASSTATNGVLPDSAIVRPNSYETGRCNIIVHAESAPSSIDVNLTDCGLTNGQSYVVKNAFNYHGSNVATGTYNSGSPTISLSLTGAATTVEEPHGLGFTPATSCPEFCSFVVLPTGASQEQEQKLRPSFIFSRFRSIVLMMTATQWGAIALTIFLIAVGFWFLRQRMNEPIPNEIPKYLHAFTDEDFINEFNRQREAEKVKRG